VSETSSKLRKSLKVISVLIKGTLSEGFIVVCESESKSKSSSSTQEVNGKIISENTKILNKFFIVLQYLLGIIFAKVGIIYESAK
jgi:hypothetical protein